MLCCGAVAAVTTYTTDFVYSEKMRLHSRAHRRMRYFIGCDFVWCHMEISWSAQWMIFFLLHWRKLPKHFTHTHTKWIIHSWWHSTIDLRCLFIIIAVMRLLQTFPDLRTASAYVCSSAQQQQQKIENEFVLRARNSIWKCFAKFAAKRQSNAWTHLN